MRLYNNNIINKIKKYEHTKRKNKNIKKIHQRFIR